MDDEPDVGLVDAHAEGVGRGYDAFNEQLVTPKADPAAEILFTQNTAYSLDMTDHGSAAASSLMNALRAAYESGKAGTARIDFPDGAAYTFPALVKSCSLGAAQVDGAIGFGCVLRVNGAVESVSA